MKSSRVFSRAFIGALLAISFQLHPCLLYSQHVFIVVIDGARYQETLGGKEKYIPRMWNELRVQGTIFTNFRNEGWTKTCPGHASLLTGTWQHLKNDGSERPTVPTLFELHRKSSGGPEQSCFVVSGKSKLKMLTYGTDTSYGSRFGATFVSENEEDDATTYDHLVKAMDSHHPALVIVNFASTDIRGHAKDWPGYLGALRTADSLTSLLWNKIQSDSIYKNNTTLFVTNDHGRHDEEHGGFQNHGDECEGCRHIMLLALGSSFPAGRLVATPSMQIDVAATVAEILKLKDSTMQGRSLLPLIK